MWFCQPVEVTAHWATSAVQSASRAVMEVSGQTDPVSMCSYLLDQMLINVLDPKAHIVNHEILAYFVFIHPVPDAS